MENFIYETPTKVYFGKDEELKVGKIIKEFNPKKVLLHYGGKSAQASGLLDRVRKCLADEGIAFVELGGVVANPELALVRKGIELCKREEVDFVLAVGGGSVLDSSKDIANGVANPEVDVWDFSLGKATPKRTLKKGAILTLAAAGSEMSNSCVITNMETKEKRGYGCSCNRMNFAIENPELTFTVNPYQNVMWASSLAHNGLTQCGRDTQLVVHQLEHEVSGLYPTVAHGAGLAALWCSWARYVYKANIMRWLQYASRVWNIDIDFDHPESTIEKAINTQEAYYAKIGMPIGLRAFGVKEEDLEPMALACSRNKTRTLKGDKPLGYNEILDIFKMAYAR